MIRGYTNIEQSRKLAEILPLESADMYYDDIVDRVTGELFIPDDGSTIKVGKGFGDSIVAWSLAALLEIIPCVQVNRMANSDKWEASSWNDSDFEPALYVEDYDNPVDACVAMILKLHKSNLL